MDALAASEKMFQSKVQETEKLVHVSALQPFCSLLQSFENCL